MDVEPVPTCDCLEELLSYPHGALIFTQFLQSIGQPDTPLVFWFACMDYRKSGSTDRDIRRVQARQIYDTFLRPDAPNRISIRDRSLVENMEADLAWPSILLFDMVATAVMEELEQDLFPLFRSSKIYQAVTDSVRSVPRAVATNLPVQTHLAGVAAAHCRGHAAQLSGRVRPTRAPHRILTVRVRVRARGSWRSPLSRRPAHRPCRGNRLCPKRRGFAPAPTRRSHVGDAAP